MSAHGLQLLAQATPGAISAEALSAGLVVVAVLAVVLMAGLVLLSRRRFDRDVREVVQTLEEVRAGHTHRRAEVDSGSPLAVVADAVHRLGHDLHARLHEAETAAERWQALTDVSRDTAVITTDTDGDVRSFSAGATALFGWEEDEVLSRSAAVVFEESSYKDLLPKLARRSLRAQGVTARSSLVRRDGSSFSAEVSVRMLRSAAGEPVGFMMAVRDITEQLRLENDLRESEKRYRGLVDGLAEGVLIVRDGRLAYVNPAAARLCGKQTRELTGSPLRDRVALADVLVLEERLARMESAPGAVEALGCTLIDDDGAELADVAITARAVEFSGGPAVLLLLRDRTAERRLGDELQRNESRLDAVLESASDAILVLGPEREGGRVLVVNHAFARMFRVRIEEVLDLPQVRLCELLQQRCAGAEPVTELIADGAATLRRNVTVGVAEPRELQVTLAPLVGREGGLLGRVVACRDLTEQRDTERQLEQRAEQLESSKLELEQSYLKLNEANERQRLQAEELDRLNAELRRLDEMKSNLLGNVSHELQTPLVSIRGYTEMILKERLGPLNDEQRKGLDLSLKNIDRLISMIDNLAAFTRSGAENTALALRRFELRPLIQEAVDLLRDELHAKELQVTLDVPPTGQELEADRDRILQVFLNLLSNAVKFNYRGGKIEIVARPGDRGHTNVTVRDSGVGIPREALGRVFDRRYRVPRDADQAAVEGSGIGLSIVRDILRMHGCTIRAESEEGRGAAFLFTLPRVREVSSADGAPDPHPVAAPPRSAAPSDDVEATTQRPRLRIIRRRPPEE